MIGFDVNHEALTGASSAISEAVSPAENLGLSAIGGASFGHDKLSGELTSFCTTWQLAVGVLRQQAMSASDALLDTLRSYVNVDQAAAAALPKDAG